MTAERNAKLNNSSTSAFKSLKTLTVMQIKEKMDFSFVGSFRKSLFKLIYFIVEFSVVTAICALLINYAAFLQIFDTNTKVLPSSVIGIIFTFMLILSIISSTWNLTKSLYLSRDNLVLLTFPASSSIVFLSKIAVYFIYEMRKNFMFLIPLFCAYGIVHEFAFYYYLWLLLLFVIISLLPVLIAALLSIPTLYVYLFLKKTKILQYALTVLLLGALFYGVIKLVAVIPIDINLKNEWPSVSAEIQSVLKRFTVDLKPMYSLTQLIIGKSLGLGRKGIKIFHDGTLLTSVMLIALSAALLSACFLIAKPLFYKMASTPFEFNKKVVDKTPENRKKLPFLSSLKKELLISARSGSLISLVAVLVVIQPLAIDLLNRIYSAMDTRFMGTQMTIAFTLFIMLLINLSSSISIASVYSRDGAASYLNKVQPSSYLPILFSKLVINLVVGLVGIAVTTARISVFYTPSGAMTALTMTEFGALIYFTFASHLLWSAEMDIMNPQTQQYSTFNEQANNPNENASAILCFIISAVVSGASFLLALENSYTAWLKVLAVTAGFLIFRVVNYVLKIRAFYKEK